LRRRNNRRVVLKRSDGKFRKVNENKIGAKSVKYVDTERIGRVDAKRVRLVNTERAERVNTERIEQVEAKRAEQAKIKRAEQAEAERVERAEAERAMQVEAERAEQDEADIAEQVEAERAEQADLERIEKVDIKRARRVDTESIYTDAKRGSAPAGRRNDKPVSKKKVVNYIINISMLVSIILLFFTGLIKYPPIQALLGIEVASIPYTAISTVHDLSGISMLVLGFFHVLMHIKGMLKTTKSIFKRKSKSKIVISLVSIALVAALATSLIYVLSAPSSDEQNDAQANIIGAAETTNVLTIEGIGEFSFNPTDINTMRSDVFADQEFSVFDIVAGLGQSSQIDLAYHFNESTDSYVIDSINGIENWWYNVSDASGAINNDNIYMDKYKFDEAYAFALVRITAEQFTARYGVPDKDQEEIESVNAQGALLALSEQMIARIIQDDLTPELIAELEAAGYNRESIDLLKTLMQEPKSAYNDGVYTGVGNAHNGTITVEVTITDGRISNIVVSEHIETTPDLAEVFNALPYNIIKNQSIEGVDTISGATEASDGYLAAVQDALLKATEE